MNMKSKIKTKDMLSLINPTVDGVLYQDKLIKLDMNLLSEYVDQPKTMNIFDKSEDIETNFYKNAALYIINNMTEQKLIYIDLDKTQPIENGLFEYIKSIYQKSSSLYVSLPSYGNNELFIKSKKLISIEDDLTVKNKTIEKATDVNLGELSSIFLETKKLSQQDLEKVTEKEKFFWKVIQKLNI